MIGVAEPFPPFGVKSIDRDNNIVDICLDDILGGWSVIYFYPKDFTFICPTEIAEMDRLVDEGVTVLGFSGDNEYCKLAWKNQNAMISGIRHNLCADTGLSLARMIGVDDEWENVALRATFILDEDGMIRSLTVNDLDTGRNVDEILRTLKALQTGGLTGCAWKPGDSLLG
jgi:peroxiredoxin (alkyl hydroperoxide reductase subunit C)